MRKIRPRTRAELPKLEGSVLGTPSVYDTNVFINTLAGREPPVLSRFMQASPKPFVAAPTRAELAWVFGRLRPDHPGTAHVLATYAAVVANIDPHRVLVPGDDDWLQAGELAGRAARALAGGGARIATAFDRVELISDALTAILAQKAGLPIVTEDGDFDVLAQLLPGLDVLFYDRRP